LKRSTEGSFFDNGFKLLHDSNGCVRKYQSIQASQYTAKESVEGVGELRER